MFLSDGKVLLHQYNNLDKLQDAVRRVEDFLFRDKGLAATFVRDENRSYPCFLVPDQVSYKDMETVLRPHIGLRSIDSDIFVLPNRKEVHSKYYFDEHDKEKIAKEMSDAVHEKLRLENELKHINKEFKARIEEQENIIQENGGMYRAGYENRKYECHVRLNFGDKTKYFVDVKEPDTIRGNAPLEAEDYALRWDHELETKFLPEEQQAETDGESEAEQSDGKKKSKRKSQAKKGKKASEAEPAETNDTDGPAAGEATGGPAEPEPDDLPI